MVVLWQLGCATDHSSEGPRKLVHIRDKVESCCDYDLCLKVTTICKSVSPVWAQRGHAVTDLPLVVRLGVSQASACRMHIEVSHPLHVATQAFVALRP